MLKSLMQHLIKVSAAKIYTRKEDERINFVSAQLSKDGERVSDKPRDDGRAERRGNEVE